MVSADAQEARVLLDLLQYAGSQSANATTAALLEEFGGLGPLLSSGPGRLRRTCGEDLTARDAVEWFSRAIGLALRCRLAERPVLGGSHDLVNYLVHAMAHLPTEQVRALFLDARNRLLLDEVVAWGGVTSVSFDHRHVVHRALELGAAGIVLAHNHPSGNPSPSLPDADHTKAFGRLCAMLGLELHDHVIVATSGICSMRAAGLLS